MKNNNIPQWLLENENYTVKKDNDKFVDKSVKQILSTLARFKKSRHNTKTKRINTSLRLFGILLLIILTACAKNFYFVYVLSAVCAVLIAVSDADTIKSILKVLLPVELLSAFILLPTVFSDNPHSLIGVTTRIFVSVTLVMHLNCKTPWSEITSALKFYRIPDIIIFTIDLTIQYISILSDVCFSMLTALKVRTIGKNKDKQKSLSGILGTTFIIAKENAQKTEQAMECRGFDGTFPKYKRQKLTKFDLLYLLGLLLTVAMFIYFQAVIK